MSNNQNGSTEHRQLNRPLEVWQSNEDQEFLYQVLAKLPADSLGPLWLVAVSVDVDAGPQTAYAETIEESCRCVWRESTGVPLPEQYRFDE